MSSNAQTVSIEEQDQRRPITWDWLLCLFAPVSVVAYHHRRASLTHAHVFGLVLVAFLSNLSTMALTWLWMRNTLSSAAVTGASGALIVQTGFLAQLTTFNKFFLYATIGLALYVVYQAQRATEKAHSELSSKKPKAESCAVLSSPKGTGSGFMSYAIAVMFPSASYAINSDSRLVYAGIALLQATIQPIISGASFGLLGSMYVPNAPSTDLLSVLSTRFGLAMAAAIAVIVAVPVRMAVQNETAAREQVALADKKSQ